MPLVIAFHPGLTEIEWLADLKTVAERIGREELGDEIRWRVETRVAQRRTRSDVLIESDAGSPLLSGEAKRPDDPLGASTLIDSEVSGAIAKAQRHGVHFCFTTNFTELALFDADPGSAVDLIERMRGNLIPLVDPALATGTNWWHRLSTAQREAAVETGLRTLFARFKLAGAGQAPSVSIDETVLSFFQAITGSLLDPMHREFVAQRSTLPQAVSVRALRSGLDPSDDQDCRYLVAQGIAELLSAALFYEVMRQNFALSSLLRGTTPASASVLRNTLIGSFSTAINVSGDYESIFVLSSIADWLLTHATPQANAQWGALFSFVERLDVASLSSDVLGVIFERLISPQRRREMGSHYTQPRLARSMAKWSVRTKDDKILDPACGAGTFLVETYARHSELGVRHTDILRKTFGNDLDPFAVHLATINLVTREISHGSNYPNVRMGDAFDLSAHERMLDVTPAHAAAITVDLEPVDVIIANPPYARSHPDEAGAQIRLAALFGTEAVPTLTGANLAAWFVVLGDGLLRPGGRMAFVLPVAALQNENLASWRAWVRGRWDMTVWHTEYDIWFSDARVASCVVLFEPPGEKDKRKLRFVIVNEAVDGDLVDILGVAAPSRQSEARDLSSLPHGDDILIAGARPSVLREFQNLPDVAKLHEISGVEVTAGDKLGHAFFKLRDNYPATAGVRRTVTGLSYTFSIPTRYLTPLLISPKALVTGEADLAGTWLLTAPDEEVTNRGLKNYISVAKTRGVHEKPSVKTRRLRWWVRSPKACDVAVPMSSQFQHQIGWMDPRGVVNNNFNAVRAADREEAELVAASIASAFGALARLYMSGEVGCEGARRILLVQIENWPAIQPRKLDVNTRNTILSTYRSFRKHKSYELDEQPPDVLTSWRRLTAAVANAAGAADPTTMADAAITEVQNTVRRRRLREAIALRGRTRAAGSAGPRLATRIRNWCSQDAGFSSVAAALAMGPDIVNIRASSEIAQSSLFAEGYLASDPVREKSLSDLLVVGFESAPPDPVTDSTAFDTLLSDLYDLFERSEAALLGDHAPEADEDGFEMWGELAASVRAGVLGQLQAEVRSQLH